MSKKKRIPKKILDLYNEQHRMLMKILDEIRTNMVINPYTGEIDIAYYMMISDWNPKEIAQKILKILQPERLAILLYLFKSALCDKYDNAPHTRMIARELGITRKDVSENLNFLANLGLVLRVKADRDEFVGWRRYVYNLLTPQGLRFVRDLLLLMLPLIEKLDEM